MKSGVRIIGGLYRGKKIPVLDMEGLRPTPNRVKETLFNWLRYKISGARCLDAFAGSGSLGFEAYSQGAHSVVMIEAAKAAYVNLKREVAQWNNRINAKTSDLELTRVSIDVIYGQAQNYMKTSKACFDIIFLDPPFGEIDLVDCLALIANSDSLLAPEGLVYVESSEADIIDKDLWNIKKSKKTGLVCYSLLEKR